MKQRKSAGGEAQQTSQIATTFADTASLGAQFAELIETVWECERIWTLDDHVDAAIRYGR
jgi:hypothetical protein